jgi:phosphate transporter
MKFSHSLQFNAVPEWSSKYIAYTTLKKLIYSLQRDSLRNEDIEHQHLLREPRDPSPVFLAALDAELAKIDSFYHTQEQFIFKSIEDLIIEMEQFENELDKADELNAARSASKILEHLSSGQMNDSHPGTTTDPDTEYPQGEDDEDEDEDEEDYDYREYGGRSSVSSGPRTRRASRVSISTNDPATLFPHIDKFLKSPKISKWTDSNNGPLPPQLLLLSETRVFLRKRIIGLYTTMSELKSYIELNQTGFKKALKKFDKSLNTSLKDDYLNNLLTKSDIFKPYTMEKVNENIEVLVRLYALICNHGNDLETAKSELSVHLREHVVWERNTVWRDMIGLERKSYAANNTQEKQEESNQVEFSWKSPMVIKLFLIIVITVVLLMVSPFEDVAQKNCFALVICASLLWATETIPLFVTSLVIPLLIVNFNVIKNPDGSVMDAVDSSKFILSTMWNSVILLLLGGFTLAAALSKYHIAKLLSTWILNKAGTSPPIVLLTIMGVALFASMWVSNVAAPVLCFSLIQPLLRTLPKDSQFINALILGIALASNVGGMASPIASPQNMIAIGAMDPPPSWGEWFVVSIPVCVLSLLLIWIFLLVTFNCNSKNTRLVPIRVLDDTFSLVQWFVVFVSVGTIFLWCIASKLTGVFGEMGIIALIPIIVFFGSGLLTTEDFNNYPWNIVVLAMGGTALGKAVSSSGLLATIAQAIQEEVQDYSLFGVTITFGVLILIMATFVSHTVAALIIVPLVAEIGNNLPEPHPRLLIMVSALLCSAAMGLPTSGFPNVTAICMTDEFGKPYLTVSTFITRGVPSSFIAYAIIVSVGFATLKLINF